MTYRQHQRHIDNKKWHDLLNNGKTVAVAIGGEVVAVGFDIHDSKVKLITACNPDATVIKIIYPSYFKLLTRWLHPLTPVTYLSTLLGIYGFAAFKQLELFWV